MRIKEQKAVDWYQGNQLVSDSWSTFSDTIKGMVAIEAITSDWNEVTKTLETGGPDKAVLLYFNIQDCGLNFTEISKRDSTPDLESITTYILQNTTSENLKRLLTDDVVTVESVTVEDGTLRVTCSANGSDILI